MEIFLKKSERFLSLIDSYATTTLELSKTNPYELRFSPKFSEETQSEQIEYRLLYK